MSDILDMALLKNSVLVRVKLSEWGIQRKAALPKSAVEKIVGDKPGASGVSDIVETEEQKQARLKKAEAMLRLTKDLIISPEYNELVKFQTRAKNRFLATYCNPSFIDEGLYSIKRTVEMPDGTTKDLVSEAIQELKLAKEEMEKTYLPKLLAVYTKQIAEAAGVLNGQFNPKDYPGIALQNGEVVLIDAGKLSSKFDITWRVTQLSVPEGLPPEIRAEEERKLRESFAKAEAKITETLYTGFAAMVEKIVDRMKIGDKGEKKVFQYTTLENLMDYIRTFRNKNVFNDVRLTELVAKAEDILQTIGTDPDTMSKRLRDYEGLRTRTATAFAELREEVNKAVTELPSRAINLEDE